MRAIAIDAFGGPGQLRLTDLPDPKVGPDFVLIGIRGAGVNPVDIAVVAGALEPAFEHHFPLVPGWDAAGVIEAVGPAVVDLRPGDEVYAYCRKTEIHLGTYAERVSLPAAAVARKPAGASFVEAGGIPLAGLTAYQALTEALEVRSGDAVVISAGAGGVGHFAVQIAKALGATVIATASRANHELLNELGADVTIDYHDGAVAEGVRDATAGGADAALDLIGGDSLAALRASLRAGGRIASVLDPDPAADRPDLRGRYIFVRPSAADLDALTALFDDGRMRVVVSETFPLERAADAQRLVAEHHTRGKVVLEV
jgi:NADPH:quinone reductase-like Zn-dependent oxidoreductase